MPNSSNHPVIKKIRRTAGNFTPILVESTINNEEKRFKEWTKRLEIEYIPMGGVNETLSGLELAIPEFPAVFAITDRDKASEEKINETLDTDYQGRRFYLPRCDFECYWLESEAIWHYIEIRYSDRLDEIPHDWKGPDKFELQIKQIAKEAVPQASGNILLNRLKNDGLDVLRDFDKIDPFLSEKQVLGRIKDTEGVSTEIDNEFNKIREYIESLLDEGKLLEIISGKKFLVKGFKNRFKQNMPQRFYISDEVLRNPSMNHFKNNPPEDFINLIKNTILPRARDLLGA